jgi:hypothetical protein
MQAAGGGASQMDIAGSNTAVVSESNFAGSGGSAAQGMCGSGMLLDDAATTAAGQLAIVVAGEDPAQQQPGASSVVLQAGQQANTAASIGGNSNLGTSVQPHVVQHRLLHQQPQLQQQVVLQLNIGGVTAAEALLSSSREQHEAADSPAAAAQHMQLPTGNAQQQKVCLCATPSQQHQAAAMVQSTDAVCTEGQVLCRSISNAEAMRRLLTFSTSVTCSTEVQTMLQNPFCCPQQVESDVQHRHQLPPAPMPQRAGQKYTAGNANPPPKATGDFQSSESHHSWDTAGWPVLKHADRTQGRAPFPHEHQEMWPASARPLV